MDDIDRALARVTRGAGGLMPLPVYRRLHDTAAASGGGTIVEIGTYRGAATIALALGATSAGLPFSILTADILRPGQGLQGQTDTARIEALQRTFDACGMGHVLRFIHGSVDMLVAAADPRDIRLLLLDGGGNLESDFAALWDRLAADAVIVVDDIDGRISVERRGSRARINQKHLISKLLVERFVEAGMLIETGRVASTGWYRIGRARPDPDEIRLMALPAYHQLVRAEISSGEFGVMVALARRLAARAPWLRTAYRWFRPAR